MNKYFFEAKSHVIVEDEKGQFLIHPIRPRGDRGWFPDIIKSACLNSEAAHAAIRLLEN